VQIQQQLQVLVACQDSNWVKVSIMVGCRAFVHGDQLGLCCLYYAVLCCAGVVLPVLGALPDSLIILTSLSSASQAEAQEAVAVGIGESAQGAGSMGHSCWLNSIQRYTNWACPLSECGVCLFLHVPS
jgi:hypothetical protein